MEDAKSLFSEFGSELKGCALGTAELACPELEFCLPYNARPSSIGDWSKAFSDSIDGIIVVRPGFMAKADPGFTHLKTVVKNALAGGRPMRTYREITSPPAS